VRGNRALTQLGVIASQVVTGEATMLDSRTPIVIFVLALIVFGTARLRSMGADRGTAPKGFRQAVRDDDARVQASLGRKGLRHQT
jgi:TatA/E family protein of Tat protein translocase